MLKKTIEYTDYNGVTKKEDFYFNLNKAEIAKMELGVAGGFAESIERLVAAQDTPAIVAIFEDLILKAYGEKSGDGKYFKKFDENGRRLSDNFKQTEAYSVLFMELSTNDKKAAEFINGIVPADLVQAANNTTANT